MLHKYVTRWKSAWENVYIMKDVLLCIEAACVNYERVSEWVDTTQHWPGQKDTLHHVEVLHKHISVRLGGEVSHCIANTKLNGPL